MALAGMSGAGEGMSDQERKQVVEAIITESASVLQPYKDGSGLAFDLSTNLANAHA